MREGALKFLTVSLFLGLGSCVPSARLTGEGGALAVSETRSGVPHAQEPGAESAPQPPQAEPPPALSTVLSRDVEGGLRVCASRRPDLAQTFVSLDLNGTIAPEEALLLQRWLKAAIDEALGDHTLNWEPQACEGRFLCFAAADGSPEDIAGTLLAVLSKPDSGAFYRSRVGTLKLAEEWDRSSANWKLHSAARALVAPGPTMVHSNQTEATEQKALLALIQRTSGSKKAASLPLYTLEKELGAALSGATLAISAPSIRSEFLPRALEKWTRKAPVMASPEAVRTAWSDPLRLEDDALDVSQGALVWQDPAKALPEEVTAALSLLVHRFLDRTGAGTRVWVQPAGGLYSLPAIRVDGPHEDVLRACAALSEEYDRLISTYGAPSEDEWSRAVLDAPTLPHFEARCLGTKRTLSAAGEMEQARAILRKAGRPAMVVWGSENEHPQSE